jgi:hypothetical protein
MMWTSCWKGCLDPTLTLLADHIARRGLDAISSRLLLVRLVPLVFRAHSRQNRASSRGDDLRVVQCVTEVQALVADMRRGAFDAALRWASQWVVRH